MKAVALQFSTVHHSQFLTDAVSSVQKKHEGTLALSSKLLL